MPENDPPSAVAKPRFFRRWGRRLAWTLLILLLLLVAFYRPLIRWAAVHFGQQAAREAGMDASWNLEGNFFSGMDLRDVKVSGNDASQVRTISLEHANLSYDLAEFRKQGVGAILKEVTISNLNADIDLTKPGEPTMPSKPKDDKPSAPLPALQFPKVNIAHVNVRLQTVSGLVEIEDFSLTLDSDAPGEISWTKVAVPGMPPLGPMKGATKLTPQSVQLENLDLRPDCLLKELSVDIAKLAQEEVAIKLGLQQGGAQLIMDGTVGNWSKDLTADADVTLTNLHPTDLASWGVPAGDIAWGVKSLAVSAHGPVLKPQEIKCTVQAQTEPLSVAGLRINGAQLDTKLEGGLLHLIKLVGGVGENEIVARGEAKLPADWAEAGQASGNISFKLDAKDLSQLSPQIQGAAAADGAVEFGAQQLRGANLNLHAKSLTAPCPPQAPSGSRVTTP
jgi:autotransporter translocation and assembly factor TamB